MSRRVVMTGLGMITPGGLGKRDTWASTLAAKPCIRPLTGHPLTERSGWQGGTLEGFTPADFMPKRLARKLDPYTQYAVAASRLALEDGAIDLEKVDRERFGVFVGNCLGGWDYTDRELRKLHTQGYKALSPFQATAWFPAAPQGQISILFGLRGHSKTLVCDRASGLVSLGYAARTIAQGTADLILAGGAEAPLTPFAYLACTTEGVVAEGHASGAEPRAYRPFDSSRTGLLPGEGAVFVVLEEREHALRRGAHVYAEVDGFALSSDACHPATLPPEEGGLSRAMNGAMSDAGLTPRDIHLLLADGLATPEGDRQEAIAIQKVFGDHGPRLPVTAPKSMTGHLYGAAGALDAAWGALAIEHRQLPPTVGIQHLDPALGLAVVTRTEPARQLETVLINSRGAGGMNASLVLRRDPGC
ncbi:beta-ketoacyl-[acyl-carrier-protein] synthase family protein [Corallococcus sp. BB11-1]|uniref:beta-ketoacyl-[acyl-carrier-protein] synthase family protein n=1 Tax=Corallococcus sp. BB11-1 TaxID=2996783 RepID=UPI002271B6E6|nr:beta-ketoacyl-[acyl-carrier-protein] synthase family protein [Corallococcus sp. BB11-1]MCY1035380.1 beta-ketoacyl-[acyl-carrier-protein] synthase family protein [Corallococcus sp. BB11-1]